MEPLVATNTNANATNQDDEKPELCLEDTDSHYL